ncbi:MAG: T9SS type A sorting domain-containing protein [Flavobacteriales bacterium]|nr:T9SS type A sorting domain-containing protein [Flavobacteriales bacterium]
MKRKVLFIVLVLAVNLGLAQNWQMFPLDSMRVYVNPFQQNEFLEYDSLGNLLTGVDFKEHKTLYDTTIIKLEQYSRLTIFESHFYWPEPVATYNGNSNFGNHIIKTSEHTLLVFQPQSSSFNDTLVFLNPESVTASWTVYQKDSLTILAKNLNLMEKDGDSIATIGLTIERLTNTGLETKVLPMKVSKKYGVIKSPVFYEIVRNKRPLDKISSVDILPYHPKSVLEFSKPKAGTIVHEFQNLTNNYMVFYNIWSNTEYYDTFYRKEQRMLVTNHYEHTFNKESYSDETVSFKSADFYRSNEYIPGRKDTNFNYTGLCQCWSYFGPCNKQILNHFNQYMGDYFFKNDTIFILPRVDEMNWHQTPNQFMENVGYVSGFNFSGQRKTKPSSPFEVYDDYGVQYLHIPGECELGAKMWRFDGSGINDISEYINFYPNPTTDFINFDIEEKVNEITAVSLDGRQTVLIFENDKIDVSNLESGIYVLEIKTDSGVLRGKVVKL